MKLSEQWVTKRRAIKRVNFTEPKDFLDASLLRIVEEPNRLILKKSNRLDLTKELDRRLEKTDLLHFASYKIEFDSIEELLL